MWRVIALRILFDHNVPVKVRTFLPRHEVQTIVEMNWPPQLENGELLRVAEEGGFDVLVTSDQNIRFQQNLTERKLALVTLGSNSWKIVADHRVEIVAVVESAAPGSQHFIGMHHPLKPGTRRT
jgi:predicted nuclease of predicted toxin-antitoxin system